VPVALVRVILTPLARVPAPVELVHSVVNPMLFLVLCSARWLVKGESLTVGVRWRRRPKGLESVLQPV
jgi:hypothetical protein